MSVAFHGSRGTVEAVENVSLEVHEGEFLCLIGPSGCGKSTVLGALAGIVTPSKGSVRAFGRAIAGPYAGMGFVQQQDHLFPWRTLRENVAFGLEVSKTPKDVREQRADQLITEVGLSGFEESFPHELSGGMRQRANIARTLAVDPAVLLMDEPFGALDALTRADLQAMLQDLWMSLGRTIVFVTHDLAEAVALGDRVVIMSERPGTVRATVSVPLRRPRDVLLVQESPEFADTHRQIALQLRRD